MNDAKVEEIQTKFDGERKFIIGENAVPTYYFYIL